MNKALLLILSLFLLLESSAMRREIPIVIKNSSQSVCSTGDFKFYNSGVDLVPLVHKILPKQNLNFKVFPLYGNQEDVFSIKCGREEICKLVIKYQPSKGFGPFVTEINKKYRVVKIADTDNRQMIFEILNEQDLPSGAMEKAVYLNRMRLDKDDIAEQTGLFSEQFQHNAMWI